MRAILYLLLALVAACGGQPEPETGGVANIAEAVLPDMPPEQPMPGPQPDAAIAGISADPHEHPVTPAQTMAEEPGPAVAAVVVRRYFDRIAAGRADAAWELWDEDGDASGMSQRDFTQGFKQYAAYRATIGTPGPMEADAGGRHVTIPVEISGAMRDGTPFAMAGSVTLHRTGVIDGATAAQRQWRISNTDMQPRPDLLPTGAEAPAATLADANAVITARYACTDGSSFVASFDHVASALTLRRGGRTLGTLARQPTGSGIHYAGGGIALRGKGDAATITFADRPPLECTAGP
ncbi:MliC family protein [Sphingomonas sp. 37zxx]|uniref:MliC family protein n=1 Tax=Sphingomonas sp. 37zxx TaxID=1550073 RepID=UPI0018CE7E09|nr:MliC family protein [Sphingomonas sp. 37zxx]